MVNLAQAAPGPLEGVRALLNTWLIPNDTRVATDVFDGSPVLRDLRDDLRKAVEERRPELLDAWVGRLGMRPVIARTGLAWTGTSAGSDVLGTVLDAIADGTWTRLKACPDCRWVFYDHTRNASKRWCLMTAGRSGGRSCGSIAKVRAYRDRHDQRLDPPARSTIDAPER